ncbi:MAG: hypothetical protein JW958_04315 [Candidatus Eisenbacteria bacterium]|nr:hypothetical protein [Candidatus Eisenbacteria bacterium]
MLHGKAVEQEREDCAIMRMISALVVALTLLSCSHQPAVETRAPVADARSPVLAALLSRDKNQIYVVSELFERTAGADPDCGLDFSGSYRENVPAIICIMTSLLSYDLATFREFEAAYEMDSWAYSPMFSERYWK